MMLHEQGYEVIGITMKTWDYANSGGSKKETGCCSLDSINDARQVAVDRGFHHFIVDIREDFGDYVIDNFVDEYMAGRTPNPCVLCNTHIKWDALLRRADQLDCEFIATGHYAKIDQENGRHFIRKSKDLNKDQSYVLWGLSQECLKRTIFPLGEYIKPLIGDMMSFPKKQRAMKSALFRIMITGVFSREGLRDWKKGSAEVPLWIKMEMSWACTKAILFLPSGKEKASERHSANLCL
jgi:tRNA U34 2-thiouridine synthase MnmA/TrmU